MVFKTLLVVFLVAASIGVMAISFYTCETDREIVLVARVAKDTDSGALIWTGSAVPSVLELEPPGHIGEVIEFLKKESIERCDLRQVNTVVVANTSFDGSELVRLLELFPNPYCCNIVRCRIIGYDENKKDSEELASNNARQLRNSVHRREFTVQFHDCSGDGSGGMIRALASARNLRILVYDCTAEIGTSMIDYIHQERFEIGFAYFDYRTIDRIGRVNFEELRTRGPKDAIRIIGE